MIIMYNNYNKVWIIFKINLIKETILLIITKMVIYKHQMNN